MGFLNHATSNIIIDAVLTERGRELLARNDGSFNISSFTFGDDEVDYSLIRKYGLTIGKEKIEKNTPIFEANPNENIAIKHPLISFQNPLVTVSQLPELVWSNKGDLSQVSLQDVRGTGQGIERVEKQIDVKNYVEDFTETLNENITDNSFFIKVHGELLQLKGTQSNAGLEFIDVDVNGIETYSITTSTIGTDFTNQKFASFKVYSNGVVTASDFQKYSTVGNANVIRTTIQIIGSASGAYLIIPVVITKNNT